MKVKHSKEEQIFQVFNYIILTFLVIICVYPMWYVAVASVSDSSLLMQHSGILVTPLKFTTAAYKNVLANPQIASGYRNTLFILIVGVILDILMTSLGAYFLSRKNVKFKKAVMILIVATMFVNGGIIPTYLNIKSLNLTNSLWGLIIPVLINTQNLVILKTSFESIPDSLEEAAKIDGASHFAILFKIILPLSKAILAVLVLYYGVAIWNSWFWASAIIRDTDLYPLQVVLRGILLQNDISAMSAGGGGDVEAIAQSVRYATIIVATVPILCIYPFIQKYFAQGTMTGAVKE